MVIQSPHERTRKVITGERIANGRELALKTHTWMENHEDAFFDIYRYVKGLQGIGKAGRLRDRVAVFCMAHGIRVGNDPYSFGNAYWAGISRYMALYDRTLIGAPIQFADSDIDCYGLIPVSYLKLGGNGGRPRDYSKA